MIEIKHHITEDNMENTIQMLEHENAELREIAVMLAGIQSLECYGWYPKVWNKHTQSVVIDAIGKALAIVRREAASQHHGG